MGLYAVIWAALLMGEAVNARGDDEIVLRTPEVVAADSPFTVEVSLGNASWPNPDCQGPGDCAWSYFRPYLMADPTKDHDPAGEYWTVWHRYCYLSGCVATNVTSFNASIPAESFPSGSPYSLDYAAFNVAANGSESFSTPEFSSFSATKFKLSGAAGSWTDFELERASQGIEDGLNVAPCDRVPCLVQCQTKYVAPYAPEVRKMGEELDACVADCLEGVDPLEDCVVENATVSSGETETTASSEPAEATTTEPSWATGAPLPVLGWAIGVALSAATMQYLG